MDDYAIAIKDVALIVLIVGGAGGLKEVMIVSGVNETIVETLTQINIHPYLLAWMMAAIIRVCVGSATAAGLMTASVLLPLLQLTDSTLTYWFYRRSRKFNVLTCKRFRLLDVQRIF